MPQVRILSLRPCENAAFTGIAANAASCIYPVRENPDRESRQSEYPYEIQSVGHGISITDNWWIQRSDEALDYFKLNQYNEEIANIAQFGGSDPTNHDITVPRNQEDIRKRNHRYHSKQFSDWEKQSVALFWTSIAIPMPQRSFRSTPLR